MVSPEDGAGRKLKVQKKAGSKCEDSLAAMTTDGERRISTSARPDKGGWMTGSILTVEPELARPTPPGTGAREYVRPKTYEKQLEKKNPIKYARK